jgi:hypothetical protein
VVPAARCVRGAPQARDGLQYEYFEALDVDRRRNLLAFLNRASGWAVVAAGAWFIALGETCSIVHERGWSLIWFAVSSVAVTTIAVLNAVERCAALKPFSGLPTRG